jgi:hypothetical protein
LAIESARMAIVDVFNRGVEFESRICHTADQGFVLPPVPLVIDEQGQSFFEAELADLGIFSLTANGFSHAEEFHRMEFLDGGLH